jgi:hypothetical protein
VSLDVTVVEVSAREFPKVKYLIDTIYLVDMMYQDFKGWRDTVALAEGVSVEAKIDWRSVAIHCAPQVLVVMAHDPTRSEFEDHPLYAVLPESGQFIPLTEVISLSVEESGESNDEPDVYGALNSLATHASTLDGGKKENAMKQISILRRILK